MSTHPRTGVHTLTFNNIKYGLFSINQWKEKIEEIVNAEISNLDLKGNEKQIKSMLEAQLNQLIDGVNKKIKDKNKTTVKGKLKQAIINTFVDVKDIKEGIPQYADEIMKLMQKPKSKKSIKGLLLNQVLYFQTKSVLDVFWIMVTNPEVQMKIVGILMVVVIRC